MKISIKLYFVLIQKNNKDLVCVKRKPEMNSQFQKIMGNQDTPSVGDHFH